MRKSTEDMFLLIYLVFSVKDVATQTGFRSDKTQFDDYEIHVIPRRTTKVYSMGPTLPSINFVTTGGFIPLLTPQHDQTPSDQIAIPHILTTASTDSIGHAPPSGNVQQPSQHIDAIQHPLTTIPLRLNVDHVTASQYQQPTTKANSFINISMTTNQVQEQMVDNVGYTTVGINDATSSNGENNNIGTNTETGLIEDIGQMRALLEHMFDQYDKRTRPRSDQSQTVVIRSSFVPYTVIEMNTQEQIFSVNGYFKFHWTDELLQWDPQMYNVTKTVRIPTRTMWLPKIKIVKDVGGKSVVGSHNTDIALLHYSGAVMWWPEDTYSSTLKNYGKRIIYGALAKGFNATFLTLKALEPTVVCQVDITFYPYDEQRCTLSYYVDDEDISTVKLELLKAEDGVDMTDFVDNAEWKVINTANELRQADNMCYIDYHFTLERRVHFVTLTLIVPALALSLLCPCTFLVPINSGDKGTLSMNVFLACCLYMTVLVTLLPYNAIAYSYFLLYVIVLLSVSVFLIAYTIVESRIFDIYGNTKCIWFSARLGQCGSGLRWPALLKLLDNGLCVLSTVVLVLSYWLLSIAMTRRQ